MHDDDDRDDGRPRRSFLWYVFCMPGAMMMWWDRMYPDSVERAISARHRKDNVFVQFITTIALYAVIYVFWRLDLFRPIASVLGPIVQDVAADLFPPR